MASSRWLEWLLSISTSHWSTCKAQKWFESNQLTFIQVVPSDDWETQPSGADWSFNAGILRTLWGSNTHGWLIL